MSNNTPAQHFQYCPHCGTTREGLTDDQACWRCDRLPVDFEDETSQPQPDSVRSKPKTHAKRRGMRGFRLIVIWSVLGIVVLGGILFVILTNDDDMPNTGGNTVEAIPTSRQPTASASELADTDSGLVDDDEPTATLNIIQATLPPSPAVLVGDDAATFAAQRSVTVPQATLTFTPLPTPSQAPSLTPNTGAVDCPGAPATRLEIDVRITTLTGLNLRSVPNAEGPILEELQSGVQLTVVGGPQCSGDVLWWLVQLDGGTVGWLAEGNLEAYFVEPVS